MHTQKQTIMKTSVLTVLALIIGVVIGALALRQFASTTAATETVLTPTVVPTPTSIVRSGPTVINAVQTQAKLDTVAMNIAKDQEITRVSGIRGVCSETIVYLGYYDVTAGVNLDKLAKENIVVTNDGNLDAAIITITIPRAEISSVTLDTSNSRMLLQQTPKWVPGCETQVADMTIEAQQNIQKYAEATAIEKGILRQSQEEAGLIIEKLLLDIGYRNITVQYED